MPTARSAKKSKLFETPLALSPDRYVVCVACHNNLRILQLGKRRQHLVEQGYVRWDLPPARWEHRIGARLPQKAILQNFNIDLLKELKPAKGRKWWGNVTIADGSAKSVLPGVTGQARAVLARSDNFRDFPSAALRG